MSDLENNLLGEDKLSNPVKYLRYVDDTICIFKSKHLIPCTIRRLKSNSVLNFTHEIINSDSFNFLDVSLKLRPDRSFDTLVYIKPTNKGLYANYSSHVPDQYKHSVVSSLVNRALKVCSNPESRNAELSRLTQTLVNNGYPQYLIDRIISAKIRQREANQATSRVQPATINQSIEFYSELHNVSNLKMILEDFEV